MLLHNSSTDTPDPGPSAIPETTAHRWEVRLVGGFEGFGLTTIARIGPSSSGSRPDHAPGWLGSELTAILGVDPAQLDGLAGAVVVGEDERHELLGRLDRAHVILAPEARRRPITWIGVGALDALESSLDAVSQGSQRVTRRLVRHLRERVVPEFEAHERAQRAGDRAIGSIEAAHTARNKLEFERRCFEAAALERLLDRLERSGLVASDLLTAYRLVASELAIGAGFDRSRESLTHGWSTPTQIAARWLGQTPSRVGALLAELGLAGSRAHSRAYLSKARGHERTVVAHVYSPTAVRLVEQALRRRGDRAAQGSRNV